MQDTIYFQNIGSCP